jgi:hypothetical protein
MKNVKITRYYYINLGRGIAKGAKEKVEKMSLNVLRAKEQAWSQNLFN